MLLNPNGQAGPTLPLAQFRLNLSSPGLFRYCHFRRAPFVSEFDGNLGASCYAFFLVEWLLVYCYSSLGAPRVRPENVTWLDTAA
jgi:hypothetical protein